MVDWGYTGEKKGHPVTVTEANWLRMTRKFPKQKVSRDKNILNILHLKCKIASSWFSPSA